MQLVWYGALPLYFSILEKDKRFSNIDRNEWLDGGMDGHLSGYRHNKFDVSINHEWHVSDINAYIEAKNDQVPLYMNDNKRMVVQNGVPSDGQGGRHAFIIMFNSDQVVLSHGIKEVSEGIDWCTSDAMSNEPE